MILAWQIEFDELAIKQLAKMDKPIAKRITTFLRERVSRLDDPRSIGQALKGTKFGELWKYRAGDYRIISSIEDDTLRILVLRVGNRREIYR